jgi:NAD(P)H dehydrogenase (quinone)
MLCLTLGGRDHMFGEGSVHGSIEQYLSSIHRGSLAYTGFEVLLLLLPIMSHISPMKNEKKFLLVLKNT